MFSWLKSIFGSFWIFGSTNTRNSDGQVVTRSLSRQSQTCASEILLGELKLQLNEIELREKVRNEKLQNGDQHAPMADYSWLIDRSLIQARKTESELFDELQQMKIEQLCTQIEPSRCSLIIGRFRQRLVDSILAEEGIEEKCGSSKAELFDLFQKVLEEELSRQELDTKIQFYRWVNGRQSVSSNSISPADNERRESESVRITID